MKFGLAIISNIGSRFAAAGRAIRKTFTIRPSLRPVVKHTVAVGVISFIVLLVHKEVYSFMMGQKAYKVDLSPLQRGLAPSWAGGVPSANGEVVLPTKALLAKALPSKASAFDDDLIARVGETIRQNPWVKEVINVRIEYPNSVRVRLKFREPVIAVLKGRKYYLVDDEMVRLPGVYDKIPTVASGCPLRALGVASFVPGEGERWEEEDVAAAIRMADIIRREPLFRKTCVTDIDVANLRGRIDRTRSEIVLLTANEVRVEWGRIPKHGGAENFIEIPTAEKMSNLRMVLDAYPGLNGLKSIKIFVKNTPVIVERDSSHVGQKK